MKKGARELEREGEKAAERGRRRRLKYRGIGKEELGDLQIGNTEKDEGRERCKTLIYFILFYSKDKSSRRVRRQ